MQKIKFKIEYKPLSDAAISKHKDFDALMKAYVVAPKPNFIKRFLNNKWMLFSGGIISGAMITALVLTQTTHNNAIADSERNNTSISNPATQQTEIILDADALATMEASNTIEQEHNTVSENTIVEKKHDEKSTSAQEVYSVNPSNDQQAKGSPLFEYNTGDMDAAEKQRETFKKKLFHSEKDKAGKKENRSDIFRQEETVTAKQTPAENTNEPVVAILAGNTSDDVKVQDETYTGTSEDIEKGILVLEDKVLTESDTEHQQPDETASAAENNVVSGAVTDTHTEMAKQEKTKKEKPEKIKTEKENKQTDKNEMVNNTMDTAQQITMADKIDSWKLFRKNADSTGRQNAMDSVAKNSSDTTSDDFKNRYAQLSFFTPLSTNGLDGYKYRHNLSVNILQGYNGALNGVEGAGIANIEKGYARGVQGAGVANVIGGNLTGVQGAGVFNIARNTKGVQGAGVANLSTGSVTGVQGAGVFNIATKDVHGLQAAGVLNIITTKDTSEFLQAAGVINFSLADATGMQASGVLNIANTIHGAQIGLINIAKKTDGVQIGLINIADTMNGAAIGLISYSRNGIFDIDISTNDFFSFNAAIRTGGPRIYNIFTFGVAPLNDTMRYGYGIGIGGEIPFKQFYADIDAIGWDVHEDKFEFNYNNSFHMINQLRITAGYKLNKYISFYAGPVLNVEIYNNALSPFNDNPISEYVGSNATTNLSVGYVAGVRFF